MLSLVKEEDCSAALDQSLKSDQTPTVGPMCCCVLWDVPYRKGSHRLTCHWTQMNTPHLDSSEATWYLIYLPWRDGRL